MSQIKIWNSEDELIEEIFDEIAELPQPIYFYMYDDDDITWYMVSLNPIMPDNLEEMFEKRIEAYNED